MERGDVIAAWTIRQILVDYTKQRNARKRGSGAKTISLDQAKLVPDDQGTDLLLQDSTFQE